MGYRHLSQAQDVVVEARDAFGQHGEELVRARYSPVTADRGFEWPQTPVTLDNFRNSEVIVGRVGGVVVGRAILDAAFYPLAEFENLEVSPPYRGRGVGGAIIQHAIETAARAGFLAIHAQTSKDNTAAHRLYAQHGFLPATRGEMLRVWRFINLPVLPQFLHDHPMALFDSRRAGDREHVLRWRDIGSRDELAVTIRGGSCQSDSNSIGPEVSALRLRSNRVRLTATLDGDRSIQPGGTISMRVALANNSARDLVGGFRIGLNPGFSISSDYPGGEQFSIPAGGTLERSVTVALASDFPISTLGICAYRSVPVSVDFLLGDHTFWLAAQARIHQERKA